MIGIDIWSIYVVVQTVGLDPCPNATFIPMTPKIKFLFVVVAIFDYMIRHVASVVYVLRMLRICEPHDNRHHLIAAFRRPWPCDIQSVGVARVDGLDDPLPRPFVFIVYRRVEVCGDDAFGDGAADDAAFE